MALEDVKTIGIGGNFISSRQTLKLFSEAYHTSTIFPRVSLEKWQELDSPDALKFLRERTLDLMNLPNYPADQLDLLQNGEYLIAHGQILPRRQV